MADADDPWIEKQVRELMDRMVADGAVHHMEDGTVQLRATKAQLLSYGLDPDKIAGLEQVEDDTPLEFGFGNAAHYFPEDDDRRWFAQVNALAGEWMHRGRSYWSKAEHLAFLNKESGRIQVVRR